MPAGVRCARRRWPRTPSSRRRCRFRRRSHARQEAPQMLRQCSGITKAGKRCNSMALPESDFCISHDPTRIADLAEYRRRGGKGRSNDARARKALSGGFKDVQTAQAVMLMVLAKLNAGQFDVARANAMANVA